MRSWVETGLVVEVGTLELPLEYAGGGHYALQLLLDRKNRTASNVQLLLLQFFP